MEQYNKEKLLKQYKFEPYHRKEYPVKIQRVKEDTVYNVPDHKNLVYNYLEQAYEPTEGADYVVTGILGEMWPITEEALKGYQIADRNEITYEPKTFLSRPNNITYYAARIDKREKVNIKLRNSILLHANAASVEHGEGDYLIYTLENVEDLRVINGKIFPYMYERIK